MKKAIKRHLFTTSILYLVIYLFYSFSTWDLINPFDWILNIPKYDFGDRFSILFFFCFYHIVGVVLHNQYLKENNKINKQ